MPRNKSFEPDQALHDMTLVFWEKGYEATSISDLEHATGLNKRSLYNTFGDKETIFDAVVKGYMNQATAMRGVLLREPLGLKNIRDFFAQMKYEPNSRGCLVTKTINQKDLVSAKTFEAVEARIFATEDLLYRNLLPEVRRKRKAKRLAAFLTSSIQGITTMANLDPDPERLRDVVKSIFRLLESEIPER